MKNKLKQFWEYLNTSHGTHTKTVLGEDGYYLEDVDVPDKTLLEKTIIISIAVGVLTFAGLGIRGCIREEKERREFWHQQYTERSQEIKEKEIPSPKPLEDYVYYNIYVPASNRSFIEFKIKTDKKVEKYRKTIKEKIAKGYLTPDHAYYEDYEKIFGKEDWWPKKD